MSVSLGKPIFERSAASTLPAGSAARNKLVSWRVEQSGLRLHTIVAGTIDAQPVRGEVAP